MEQHWGNGVADETMDVFRISCNCTLRRPEGEGLGELSPWTGHWVET